MTKPPSDHAVIEAAVGEMVLRPGEQRKLRCPVCQRQTLTVSAAAAVDAAGWVKVAWSCRTCRCVGQGQRCRTPQHAV